MSHSTVFKSSAFSVNIILLITLMSSPLFHTGDLVAGTPRQEGEILMQLGKDSFDKGKYSDAEVKFNNAASIYKDSGNLSDYYDSKYWEVNTRFRLGKNQGMAPYMEAMIADCKRDLGAQHENLAQLYYIYAIIDHYALRGRQSLELSQHALDILKSNDKEKSLLVANCYNHIGNHWSQSNDYLRSIDFYEQSLTIKKELLRADHPSIAITYNNLGIAFNKLGDNEKALSYYQKSLEIKMAAYGDLHPRVSDTFFNIGMVYFSTGDYTRSIEYFENALAIDRQNEEQRNRNIAHRLISISEAYFLLGEHDKAIPYAEESLVLYQNVEGINPELSVTAYQNLGSIYHGKGDYKYALQMFKAALEELTNQELSSESENPIIELWNASDRLYKVLNEKLLTLESWNMIDPSFDKLETALNTTEVLVQCINYLQQGMSEEHSKFILLEDSRHIIEAGLRICHQLSEIKNQEYYLKKAFNLFEHGKSILLRHSLQNERAKTIAQIPEDATRHLATLTDDLFDLSLELRTHDQESYERIRNEIFAKKIEYHQFIESLEIDFPRYQQLKNQVGITSLTEVQEYLSRANETSFGWFLGESSFFTFQVSGQNFDMSMIEMTPAIKQELIGFSELVSDNILANENGNSIEVFRKFVETGNSVYNYLFPKNLPQETTLTIVPDDILNFIPFELLLVEAPEETSIVNYSDLDYLLKEAPIRYASSFSLLASISDPAHPFENELLAFAPTYDGNTNPLLATRSGFTSLKFAQSEVHALHNHLQVKSFIGDQSSESNFKRLASKYRFLHLAMHAYVDEEAPAYSGLIFSETASSEDDETLFAYEIANMHIPAELTVLSACNTGTGMLVQGEGPLSLARSFREAGSANILMSLWQVDDESTSEIMSDFYAGLKNGLGKAEALQQAKLQHLTRYRKTFPHYWGAFILMGDNQPVDFNTSNYAYWMLLLIFMGISLFTTWKIRKSQLSTQ